MGRASYFLGDVEGAIPALIKQDELDGEDDPINWLTLAMAHHVSGDEAEAKSWYRRALLWMATNSEQSGVRTQWFLAEATRVLGVG